MVKCDACKAKRCGGIYRKYHQTCQNPKKCSCTCQEPPKNTFLKAASSIGIGLGCFAGGVALTVLTGGVGAVAAGGLLVGAGSSMITNPIGKKKNGERMNVIDMAFDVAVGSIVGVLSGGLGAGGSALAKGASIATKAVVQVGAGATTGALAGGAGVTVQAIKGEKVTPVMFAKAMGVGAVCGAVGGASGQAAGVITKDMSNAVAKAATRVTVQAATAGVTDATIQVVENDGDLSKINVARTLLATATSATLATTAECAKVVAVRSNAYTSRMNEELVKGSKSVEGTPIPEEKQKAILQKLDELNSGSTKKQIMEQLQPNKLDQVEQARDVMNKQLKTLGNNQDALAASSERVAARKVVDGSMIGKDNVHALTGERRNQVACDLSDGGTQRGAARVIVDAVPNGNDRRFVFSDLTERHDYQKAMMYGERQFEAPKNPLLPNQELLGKTNFHDDKDDENDKKKQ